MTLARRLGTALLLPGLLLVGCSTEGDLPSKAARAPVAPINSIFVSRGDNLYKLAQQYNVPVRDLIEANGLLAPYMLQPGQRLLLPLPKVYIVKSGDTLYGLARQYQVSVSELVRLNGLQQPYNLKAGQSLNLPGQSPASGASAAAPPSQTVALAKPVQPPPAPGRKPDMPPAATSSPAERTQRPAVEVATLPPAPAAAVSSPARPAMVPPVSSIQGGRKGVETEVLSPPPAAPPSTPVVSDRRPAAAAASPAAAASAKAVPPPAATVQTPTQVAPPATVVDAPPPSQVATAVPPPPKDDTPPARAGNRFLWPLRGPILSGFGDKPGGLRNDGINIGAPKGTAVMAADNGIVAYAGNQLKSFGNLVLIRHDGGWITVYAHLDAIAVEQGQRVTRGQGIGTVGQTGNVKSAQLHFAVRKGEQVLNPLDQLEK